MEIIDAHQHFWKYNIEDYAWIDDEMNVLRKDFMPEDLGIVLKDNNVDGCIAVQARQTEEETAFLVKLSQNHTFIRGVVGWIDLCSPDIDERLAFFSQSTEIKGYRHVVQAEPDPNFMKRDDFRNGLSELSKYELCYDVLIFPHQLEAALDTIQRFPSLNFVIDHMAKPYIKEGQKGDWPRYIRAIGELENAYCKISGIVTEADWHAWNYDQIKPWLDVVFSAFDTTRIMFGSDWPVCLLAGSYAQVKGIIDRYLMGFSDVIRADIMGRNAARFYKL